jgi:hypothetical protein
MALQRIISRPRLRHEVGRYVEASAKPIAATDLRRTQF